MLLAAGSRANRTRQSPTRKRYSGGSTPRKRITSPRPVAASLQCLPHSAAPSLVRPYDQTRGRPDTPVPVPSS
jgi:hypothetical protein